MTYAQLLSVCFVLNGFAMVVAQVVSKTGVDRATPVFLASMFGTAMVLTLLHPTGERTPVKRKSLGVGLMAGLGSVAGQALTIRAATMAPGYVVFPVVSGGLIVLVALVSWLVFKEKIGVFGVLGIAVGVVAIALLSA